MTRTDDPLPDPGQVFQHILHNGLDRVALRDLICLTLGDGDGFRRLASLLQDHEVGRLYLRQIRNVGRRMVIKLSANTVDLLTQIGDMQSEDPTTWRKRDGSPLDERELGLVRNMSQQEYDAWDSLRQLDEDLGFEP